MNWKALKQLHELYETGTTSKDLWQHSYVKLLVDSMGYIDLGNKLLHKTDLFDDFYKRKHLAKFERIQKLLIRYNFVSSNLKENDLEILLKIEHEKEIIRHKEYSRKKIATHYFDDSKYLKKGSKLDEITLKILDVKTLRRDEHDQQFLYVLHCQSKIPKAILLCENDDQVREPRLKDIELWFAGGRNTAKLAYVSAPQIPMYYLCDWDNKGMEIYQGIKRNYFPEINLIVPKTPKFLPIKSEWKTDIEESLFTEDALQLLRHLKENNLWIEEESIEFPTLTSNS